MPEERHPWLEAGVLAGKDPDAKIPCPDCNAALLQIFDQPLPPDYTRLARHMLCPACGSYNELLMKLDESVKRASPDIRSPRAEQIRREAREAAEFAHGASAELASDDDET